MTLPVLLISVYFVSIFWSPIMGGVLEGKKGGPAGRLLGLLVAAVFVLFIYYSHRAAYRWLIRKEKSVSEKHPKIFYFMVCLWIAFFLVGPQWIIMFLVDRILRQAQ
jgi:hypothetical protein